MKNRSCTKAGLKRFGRHNRTTKERILIVCEGEKTEPKYFNAIRTDLRLSTADVKCVPSDQGTNPLNVVASALNKIDADNAWDRVYCVFDRDEHSHFDDAVRKVRENSRQLKNDEGSEISFEYIVSNPCFELWLLLHFESVTAEKSSREVLDRLKTYVKKYSKGCDSVYADTKDNLQTAYMNERRICGNANGTVINNPYTNAGTLVKLLFELKS